jgi:3'-phosphoadenosine 5'-phosphosulfate (PAPS) 3'-phosphatase
MMAKPRVITVRRGAYLRDPLEVAVGFSEQNLSHLTGCNIKKTEHAAQQRTCKVATGECDITGINKGGSGGFNSWDIAGPHAVLRAAGGEIVTMDKKPLRYGKSEKVPAHCAASLDVLLALDLVDKTLIQSGQQKG